MASFPEWLSASLASDASEGRSALAPWIRPLYPGVRAVGPALVALATQDDHQAVVRAIADSPLPGLVVVVQGQATSRAATIGDLMALEMQSLGLAGLVTDGLVRDSREIRELGFPVWCRGTTPVAPGKAGPGALGGPTVIGGVLVMDGDLVIADEDGVVVWPSEGVPGLMKQAEARYELDIARRAHLLGKLRARLA